VLKDDLIKWLIITIGRNKPKIPYREICDSVVDGLLLRDLSLRVSNTLQADSVTAHLIVGDRLLESLDEFHHLA